MQLQKQAKRATREKPDRTHAVRLEKFNPVVKPGYEMVIASTLHNMEAATHVVVTTRPRATC